MLPHFGSLLGYEGPESLILSKNLPSALIDPTVIDKKLSIDLAIGRVIKASPITPFLSSPLGLVPKHDGRLRKIHHLSYSGGRSVNNFTANEYSTLCYTKLANFFAEIVYAGSPSMDGRTPRVACNKFNI